MAVVRCLECGSVLVSTHNRDFKQCNCENRTFVDGGDNNFRLGGKDLDRIIVLDENRGYMTDQLKMWVGGLDFINENNPENFSFIWRDAVNDPPEDIDYGHYLAFLDSPIKPGVNYGRVTWWRSEGGWIPGVDGSVFPDCPKPVLYLDVVKSPAKNDYDKLRTALKKSTHFIETIADLKGCYCSYDGVCLYHKIIEENSKILKETSQ